jgi:asparagine synthase (glutamine-hydrolysing)
MDRLLYLESMTSLPDDMLVKVDRAAMGVSLETRVPFLDHRVLEFSWKLPLSMRMRDGIGKWVLRQVLNKYVPQSLIERPKGGFSVPIDVWLKGPLREWAEGYMNEKRLKKEGYLNAPMVTRRWEEHLQGKRKWQWHLWGVLMFQAWLESQKVPQGA